MASFDTGKYSEDELAGIVQEAISTNNGFDEDGSNGNKLKAQRAYLGKNIGNEQAGRSKQQSLDVADMVNAAVAQLTPMLSTDCFAVFEPTGQEDEEAAKAETNALNKVIMEDNQGYLKFISAIHDTALQRMGILKVVVDEVESSQPVEYDNPTDEELGYIQDEMIEANQELIIGKTNDEGLLQAQIITTKRSFLVKNVDPLNYYYDIAHTQQDQQSCSFTAERIFPTRSALIEEYDISKAVVDDLPTSGHYDNTNRVYRDTEDEQPSAYQEQLELIECYECYMLLCMDNTGIAQRYRVLWCNNIVLDMEPYPWVPFAVGTAMIYPHDAEGESFYDRIMPIQAAKTFTLRQWADNMESLNNARMGIVDGQVNLDDVLSGVPGGAIRMRSPDSIVPIIVPDLGSSAVASLEYQDKLRMERGGASLDMQAPEFQVMGDTAHGIERQYSSKELTVQMMGKTLAETLVRQTYLIMHQALRRWSNEPLMVKAAGSWIQVNPAEWPVRTQLNVTVGQTIGQRNSAQQALMTFIQLGTSAMQNGLGGQLVDLGGIYKAMADWLKMAGIDNPDAYLIDPASPQAQEAQQGQAQQQQQMQQMQMQLQQQVAQFEKYKHDSELQFKYFDTVLDSEVKEGIQISNVQVEAAKLASNTIDSERNRQESSIESASNSGESN